MLMPYEQAWMRTVLGVVGLNPNANPNPNGVILNIERRALISCRSPCARFLYPGASIPASRYLAS